MLFYRKPSSHGRSGNSRLDYLLWFLCGFLAPMSFLRLPWFNFTAFDCLMCGCYGLLLLRNTPPTCERKLAMFEFLFIIAILLSLFRAIDFTAALGHLIQWSFIFLVCIPVTYRMFSRPAAFTTALLGLGAAVGVIVVYGYYEVNYLPKPYSSYRYGSLYGDGQMLGFNLAVCSTFVLLLIRQTWHLKTSKSFLLVWRLACLGLLAGILYLLPNSFSRTGLLGTSLAIGAFLSLYSKTPEHRFSLKFIFRSGIIAALILGGLYFYLTNFAPERLVSRIDDILTGDSRTISVRSEIWKEALFELPWNYYLVGAGPDNYHLISAFSQKPHNIYILFLIEGGALMVLSLIGILAYFFGTTFRAISRGGDIMMRNMLVACFSSMIAFMAISFVNTQSINRIYWFIFALGLAASRYLQSNASRPPVTKGAA